MSGSYTRAGRRLSFRGGLLLLAALAAGAAALRFASTAGVKEIVQILSAAVVLAVCVMAIVYRGRRQVFAVGFAICAGVYWIMQWANVPYFVDGFGTSQLTYRLHARIATGYWVERSTGKVVGYDRDAPPAATFRANSIDLAGAGFNSDEIKQILSQSPVPASQFFWKEMPAMSDFFTVANCLWALLFGQASGAFAVYLDRRRQNENAN